MKGTWSRFNQPGFMSGGITNSQFAVFSLQWATETKTDLGIGIL
jgi:hypothetical protein